MYGAMDAGHGPRMLVVPMSVCGCAGTGGAGKDPRQRGVPPGLLAPLGIDSDGWERGERYTFRGEDARTTDSHYRCSPIFEPLASIVDCFIGKLVGAVHVGIHP